MPHVPHPERNKAGQRVWFVASRGGDGGVYEPVTRQGCWAFLAAAIWLLLCGATGMAGFAATHDWRWLGGMMVAGAAGLLIFARAVSRHS